MEKIAFECITKIQLIKSSTMKLKFKRKCTTFSGFPQAFYRYLKRIEPVSYTHLRAHET